MNLVESQNEKSYNPIPSLRIGANPMPFDKDSLTFDQIDAVLGYEPDTGKIFWKMKTARKILVGAEAGTAKTTREDGNAYRYIRVFGKSMTAQRVAWLLHYGDWPVGKIYFMDGNSQNLKISNLRMSNSLPGTYNAGEEGNAKYMRDHREAFPLDWKDQDLRKKFGITLAEYCAMLVAQDGKCGICGLEETATRGGNLKALAVDHDHVTGKIRGLLCQECNQAIGKFRDNRDTLLSAIRYLDKHSGRDSTPTLTVVPNEDSK
jgi:Recombination endonuclease VII/HNH endonuclease